MDYHDVEWFALEMNRDHSVVFEISVGTGLEKISFHSNPREWQCQRISKYHTIPLISHASKVMLRIIQVRIQQYVNQELSNV